MNKLIKESNEILKNSTVIIKQKFVDYLKQLDYSSNSSTTEIYSIKNIEDVNRIYTGPGFYVILVDQKFEENRSVFSFANHAAIYRGHSYSVRDRNKSHLFNSEYNSSDFKNKPRYTVCLKFEDGIQGINLDEEPYCNYSWKIIVHKMKGSNKLIREQAELAFDEIYGRPFKSKER
ncbi:MULTISPECIES: hypothetical protein [unclassified Empedobacter]|uniref:hypothetical protein n=1 Tax=unclassified Empedobacter TaxID=2643773 RepID=UPI0025C04344|nr:MULTISPECIES: hypothetical protein [unclassified Empedobacter]